MPEHEKLNYVEFPSKDLQATKKFFNLVFNWEFVDYGPEYIAFSNAGIDGGFFKSEQSVATKNGSVLLVFYSNNLASTQLKIEKAGGTVIEPTYSFPGGCRFHFADPCGNEFAVWSDLDT